MRPRHSRRHFVETCLLNTQKYYGISQRWRCLDLFVLQITKQIQSAGRVLEHLVIHSPALFCVCRVRHKVDVIRREVVFSETEVPRRIRAT